MFLRYSKAMLAAQLLEFTVFQLTHIKKKSPKDKKTCQTLTTEAPRDDPDPALS